MKLFIHWIAVAIALALTVLIVPGIRLIGAHPWLDIAFTAIIVGLVNAIIRPITAILSLPLVVLTFGLFMLVVNGLMLALASWISVNWFHTGFTIDNFWSAIVGALLLSIFSTLVLYLLNRMLPGTRAATA